MASSRPRNEGTKTIRMTLCVLPSGDHYRPCVVRGLCFPSTKEFQSQDRPNPEVDQTTYEVGQSPRSEADSRSRARWVLTKPATWSDGTMRSRWEQRLVVQGSLLEGRLCKSLRSVEMPLAQRGGTKQSFRTHHHAVIAVSLVGIEEESGSSWVPR